jgi:hypothetical protein
MTLRKYYEENFFGLAHRRHGKSLPRNFGAYVFSLINDMKNVG